MVPRGAVWSCAAPHVTAMQCNAENASGVNVSTCGAALRATGKRSRNATHAPNANATIMYLGISQILPRRKLQVHCYNVNRLGVNIGVMADVFYSDRFFYVYSCDLNVNVQIKM